MKHPMPIAFTPQLAVLQVRDPNLTDTSIKSGLKVSPASHQDKAISTKEEAVSQETFLRHRIMAQHKKWADQHGYSLPFDRKVSVTCIQLSDRWANLVLLPSDCLVQSDAMGDMLSADTSLLKMMRDALKQGEAMRAWDYAALLYFPKYEPNQRRGAEG